MEGIKEKNELLSEFNQNCGFSKNLSEMTNEGCLSGEEKSSELVFSTEMDERKSETEKGFDKDGNFKEEIEGESDQGGLGGFKDSGGENEGKIEQRKSDMGSVGDRNEGDFEGGDKEGNEWCENENRVGDNDLGGLIKEAKIDESGKFIAVEGNGSNVKKMNEGGKVKEGIEWSEIDNEVGDRDLGGFINEEAKIDVSGKFIVVEGNEDDLEKMKEGGEVEGNKWSEIDNEVGDRDLEGIKDAAENKEKNPEKRSVVEGIEGDFKIIMEGDNDKEVIKWSEIEEAEYYYNLEIKNKWIDKGKKVIEDDEDGWVEHWDDGSGRTEGDDEQQYLNNYEDEKNVNEQYGEVPYWYGNAEGNPVPRKGKERYGEEPHLFGNAIRDSLGLNYENFRTYTNPLRSDAEDCSFFMKTGTCKFGSYCKFNHPLKIKNQAARDTFKLKEEIYHSPGQAECKYYLSSGGCKYGKACRYNHIKGKAAVTPNLELNFLGLPIRVGEKECAYYMKNGSCKYGPNCRFHHPDPTVAGGGDPVSPGRSGISARMLNKTAPFRPVINPPNPSAPPNAGWNGYQAPVYTTPGRNLPIPPALAMNIPATSSFYAHSRSHLIVNEFPERPGQPECKFYMKTGDCKYRSGCKFHHPKTLNVTHSKEGLPLRPGQSVCSHFNRFGICKFGPSCKFDHSVTNCTSASSNGSDHGRPIQLSCFADEYGEWEMEQMRSI